MDELTQAVREYKQMYQMAYDKKHRRKLEAEIVNPDPQLLHDLIALLHEVYPNDQYKRDLK